MKSLAVLLSILLSIPWGALAAEGDPAADAPVAETTSISGTAPAAAPEAAPARNEQGEVVGGAPLGNTNVHVHIVERKAYSNHGRTELAIYPLVAQMNGKFTQHYGAAAMLAYHLHENLAVQLTPTFFYVSSENAFNEELVNKGRLQAQAATALVVQGAATMGVEVTPIYGKFAWYEGTLGHFAFVLNAGAGAGKTRVQLRPETADRGVAFGDTGVKFMGAVGAGFRVYLGEKVALRLEVRDLVYTARVDKVNGCSYADLQALDTNPGATLEDGCSGSSFDSPDDLPLARGLLKDTSSDVLNNVSAYGGLSWIF